MHALTDWQVIFITLGLNPITHIVLLVILLAGLFFRLFVNSTVIFSYAIPKSNLPQ